MVANDDAVAEGTDVHRLFHPTEVSSDGYVREFFPATSSSFIARCGEVAAVKVSDFDDVYRRRHLESFQKSWKEWTSYDGSDDVEDEKVLEFVSRLIARAPKTQKEFSNAERLLRKELKVAVSKTQMLAAFETLTVGHQLESDVDQFLMKKVVRSHSGVLVITVLTSPGSFSCPEDCHYCPNEPGQPRSYLSTEPAVLRANQNGWDAALQFWDRGATLYYNGHIVDKIEVLVLGGTWSGYPKSYQEEFMRDLFYAANVFDEYLIVSGGKDRYKSIPLNRLPRTPEQLRTRLSLEEEQQRNETAACRIIGLTIETRPDHVSKGELRRLRRFGVTRVQIGIQHTDDAILKKINRGCVQADAVRAIRLLKDGCFKVDIHMMPDLPGSSPQLDKEMFEFVLSSPLLQADQWKIYPCEVTPYSQIEQWYKEGKFIPYAERADGQELTQLLVKVKTAVHPWIRLNRVVRDIPNPSIIAGNDKTNLRQVVLSCMERRHLFCRCLRCREVKSAIMDIKGAQLKIRRYASFGGDDYFLSYETDDEMKLFGFLRLRIRHTDLQKASHHVEEPQPNLDQPQQYQTPKLNLDQTFPELIGCGLIRELHVYGQLVGSQEQKGQDDVRPQHTGFGKRLIAVGEAITVASGLQKLAVIAGVGTREYYRKFGYAVEGYFMTKMVSVESVSQWMEQLDMQLPLPIQLYDTRTDLGLLDSSVGLSASNDAQTEVCVRRSVIHESGAPPMEDNQEANSPTHHSGKKKHRRVTKPDILTPFHDNCSAARISHPERQALLFIDHVEHPHVQHQSPAAQPIQFQSVVQRVWLAVRCPFGWPTFPVVVAGVLTTTAILWMRFKRR